MERDLLNWADLIFVMSEREDQHHTLIKLVGVPDFKTPVIDLDIEDRWARGDPELVKRLLKKLRPHLGAPQKAVETRDNDGTEG